MVFWFVADGDESAAASVFAGCAEESAHEYSVSGVFFDFASDVVA